MLKDKIKIGTDYLILGNKDFNFLKKFKTSKEKYFSKLYQMKKELNNINEEENKISNLKGL